MPNEEKQSAQAETVANENEQAEVMDANTYVENINALKKSTVDKKEYDKLVEENKRLSLAVLNGETLPNDKAVQEKKPSIEELRQNFKKDNQTNLDFWKNALSLRDAVIENGEPDPFLPKGHELIASEDDKTKACKVAKVMKELIEESEGSPEVFNALLQKTLVDDPLLARKRKA